MSKEKNIDEITIREILSNLISKWKLILLLNFIGLITIFINYKYLVPEKFRADTTVIANFKNKSVNTYFGDYHIISSEYADYIPLLYNSELIYTTINDLGLKNFSIQEFKNSLNVEDKVSENNNNFLVSFQSKLTKPEEIINKHLEQFILFLNNNEAQNIVNEFIQKNILDLAFYRKRINENLLSIPYFDSILSEIDPFTQNITNLGGRKSNFVLSKLDLVNINYIETEKKLIDLKLDINDYEIKTIDLQRNIDSLSRIDSALQINDFSFNPFNVFNNLISYRKIINSSVSVTYPTFKKQFIFPSLILFFGILLYFSLVFILKIKK